MSKTERMDKLLDFIQNTSCHTLQVDILDQAKKCFLDLAGVLCAGAKNNTSRIAAEYVSQNFPLGGGNSPKNWGEIHLSRSGIGKWNGRKCA